MIKRTALAAVVAVAAAVALTSCVRLVHESFDDRHPVSGEVTEVRLSNGSGNVVVRSREGVAEAEVRRHVRYSKSVDKPTGDSHRLEGSTLVLDGCGGRCSVDYEVTVPSGDVKVTGVNDSGDVRLDRLASVEVEVGSGDTTVRDVAGVVRLDAGSGDVDVADVGGDFTGEVGSGNARLSGMRGAVTIEADSGNVEVRTAAAASVRAESGSGDLTVLVPPGAYRVAVDADGGDRSVEVRHDPDAAHELVLRAGSGDVAVRAA